MAIRHYSLSLIACRLLYFDLHRAANTPDIMAHKQVSGQPALDSDNSTIMTPSTPPESIAEDALQGDIPCHNSNQSSFSVPWPGSTFTISSVSSGQVLTLIDGQVILASPGRRGSIHWECVENRGWLSFRNPVSGRFLGHDQKGGLICSASQNSGWERFCVRMRPGGGYVLLMTHHDALWPLGMQMVQGKEQLAKINDGGTGGLVWGFVRV